MDEDKMLDQLVSATEKAIDKKGKPLNPSLEEIQKKTAKKKGGRPSKKKTDSEQETARTRPIKNGRSLRYTDHVIDVDTAEMTGEEILAIRQRTHKPSYDSRICLDKRDPQGARLQKYSQYEEGIDYKKISQGEMAGILDMAVQTFDDIAQQRIDTRAVFQTPEQLAGAIKMYFQYIIDRNLEGQGLIPDVEGMCAFIRISRGKLMRWNKENYKGFSDVIEQALNNIAAAKKQLAQRGYIPAVVFAIDFNNNHGYVQRQETRVEIANPLGEMINPDEIAARLPGGSVAEQPAEGAEQVIDADFSILPSE